MMTEGALPPELAAAVGHLDDLARDFEQHPDRSVQERGIELLRCVDAVHRPGLRRLAALLETAGLLPRALDDPRVRLLFELYDLGTASAVGSAGQPLANGSPGSSRAESREPASGPSEGFVPLSSLKLKRRPPTAWHTARRTDQVPAGELLGLQIGPEWVLLANLDGEFVAYRNACPGTPLPLHGGRVEDTTLECPWHHCRFDLRTGSRLDASGPGLDGMPIAVEDDEVRIAIREGVAR
jgi:nitrite reductase/ring-hydroxylating ferredoxin subunit